MRKRAGTIDSAIAMQGLYSCSLTVYQTPQCKSINAYYYKLPIS
eukprot:COSAG01_NODE_52604_length_345_cov_1.256098_1_plen_43_part_01